MKSQSKEQPKNPAVHDPSTVPHNTPRKANIENPDKNDRPQPGTKTTIDDDPDQTMKKIPVASSVKTE